MVSEQLPAMVSRRLRAAVLLFAAVALVAFAYFVWPTPFRDAQLPVGLLNRSDHLCCYAARVNRFTSEVQVLDLSGWTTLSFKKDTATAKTTAVLLWDNPKP